MYAQVLVSIQSMIFVEDTYFNEPVFEIQRNTSSGMAASLTYNAGAAKGTLQHAVLGALCKPAPAFADIIRCAAAFLACHRSIITPAPWDTPDNAKAAIPVTTRLESFTWLGCIAAHHAAVGLSPWLIGW